jgi:hypothetical protein
MTLSLKTLPACPDAYATFSNNERGRLPVMEHPTAHGQGLAAPLSVCHNDVMRQMIGTIVSQGCERLSVAVAVAAVLTGCTPTSQPHLATHTVGQPLDGPCTPTTAKPSLADVTEFVLTASGRALEAPEKTRGTGTLTLEELPIVDDAPYTLGLFGLVAGDTGWRGVTTNVVLSKDGPTPVDVLMAKVGDFGCARSSIGDGRAFHTATLLDDGNVLIVGGASSITEVGGVARRRLTASASASLYNPNDGTFSVLAPPAHARMFHMAVKLDDGRVVIAGGTSVAAYSVDDPGSPFPINPLEPVSDVEVFDPVTKTFASAGVDPAGGRVFGAGVPSLDGKTVLLTGGVVAGRGTGDDAPPFDLSTALATTTSCGGSPLSCGAGPTMNSARAGHTAVRLTNNIVQRIYVFGGGITRFEPDVLAGNTFEVAVVSGFTRNQNVFFASSTVYVGLRLLMAGGLTRTTTAPVAFQMARVDNDRGAAYVFDPAGCLDGDNGRDGCATSRAVSGGPPMSLERPQFFGSATPLDTIRVLIAGGFADLNLAPSLDAEVYKERETEGSDAPLLQIKPISVGGTKHPMRQPRAGLTVTALWNGTVVLVGGDTVDANGRRSPSSTAEIYADAEPPEGVAVP